ncbi:hypothetical protein BB560_004754 [Smittium megazygosporum]|uniref:Uncharacterized protein n=1 Tax=Smittium megazygosporum TaxID=133381 RepID=A0A2T9Z8J7_9FUNG|nr:hypothetical protein BB560_006684 [Smittium megazygosporum]PVV00847.1 hypothetical protein BB560_004754 [Smittium megazygosporum]
MYTDSQLALSILGFLVASVGFAIKLLTVFRKKPNSFSITTNSKLPIYENLEFEILAEANYLNRRNATTISSIQNNSAIPLDQFKFTSNSKRLNLISCLLYGFQVGLSWFFFVRFLSKSNIPPNPGLAKFADPTLFFWALSWVCTIV